MNAQDVQKKTAAALSREESLSFAECNAALQSVVGALGEVGDRISRITPGGNSGRTPAGKEYQVALQTGTAEDIQRLENEHKEASTLAAQLKAQREELDRRRQKARLREAQEGLPRMHDDLVHKLDVADDARAALKKALADVNSAAHEIRNARASIRVGAGHDPDGGAAVQTIQRLGALHSAFAMDSQVQTHPNNWIDDLGCAVSRNVYMTAEGKVPGFDFSACKSDEDVVRAVVLAVRGQDKIYEIDARKPEERDSALRNAFESIPLQHGPERIAA